ncbi:hypothetical protein TL16_g10015 [Triparma laevis f. inornata]|uniref:Uncharacterized protein n=2 Tax=Triparma laevis TaxID=1534972 RepID=A0A9W7DYW9_9STRA|nr:hypothetical protein TrLO_g9929 [Triparma laevis f. longispina]GMH84747.1 hypothetical protein TL16_g10015 [Triparma laevis f. inornata]
MMGCYANSTGGLQCQCANIVINTSEDCDTFCGCQSSSSWQPIIVSLLSNCLCVYNLVWGIWMCHKLIILKEFKRNAVTEALLWSVLCTLGGMVHESMELLGMFLIDPSYHQAFYMPGTGIGSLSLAAVGFGVVNCDLSIPLLWINISSGGMNKGEVASRKKKAEKTVKILLGFYLLTFLGIAVVMGMSNTGLYAILWLLAITITFNYGGRMMRKQLTENDKEGRNMEAVKGIMTFVRSFTLAFLFYLISIVWFIVAGTNEDPKAWWLPALLIYISINLMVNCNLRYVHTSLKKKFSKIKNGVVMPSTTASSAASTASTVG